MEQQETYLLSSSTFATFESVWVKIDNPNHVVINTEPNRWLEPIILVEPSCEPVPEPPPRPPEPEPVPTPKKVHKCEQCSYTTPHKHCIDRHRLIHSKERPFKCDYCEFTARTKTHLNRHNQVKHRDELKDEAKIYACEYCDYMCHTNVHLYNHKKKHRPNDHYRCSHCDYKTAFKDNFKRHLLRHEKTDVFQCDKCPFQSKYERNLQRHFAKMHKDRSKADNTCDLCGYTNKSNWRLRNHIFRSRRSMKMECDCGFETFYRCELKKHYEDKVCNTVDKNLYSVDESINLNPGKSLSKTRPKEPEPVTENLPENDKYKCKLCSVATATNSQLQRHMVEVHESITMKQCSFCDYFTHDTYRFNKHVKLSKSDELKQCLQCDFNTYQKCALRKHNRSHLSQVEEYRVHVPELNKDKDGTQKDKIQSDSSALNKKETLTTKPVETEVLTDNSLSTVIDEANATSLGSETDMSTVESPTEITFENFVKKEQLDMKSIRVLSSYDKEKPFQCSLCDYKSVYKASVQRHHLRLHMKELRPFKCTNCTFTTKTKDKILVHVKRSKSDRILTCKYCKFTTNFKCTLTTHEKTHYTLKCKLCHHVAKDSRQLKVHQDTYHSNFKYKCQFCEFTTAIRENVINHENIHKGIRPFKCNLCDYSAVRMALLTKHYKSKHYDDMSAFEIHKKKDGNESQQSETAKENEVGKESADLNPENKESECNNQEQDTMLSWNTIDADRNATRSPISMDDWQDDKADRFHVFEGNPETTPQYADIEDSIDIDKIVKYKIFTHKGKKSTDEDEDEDTEPENLEEDSQVKLSDSFIATSDAIDVNTIEIRKSKDKDKPNKCALCNFKSKHRAAVQTHYVYKHTSEDFQPFKCVYCGYVSKTRYRMFIHIKRSQSLTMLPCLACTYSTYFQCALTNHKKTHIKFRCRICKVVFKERSELTDHQASNHANNKLKCHYCDFLTMTKVSLIKHEDLHKRMRRFKCYSCNYTSLRKVLLVNHIRKKHPHLLKKSTKNSAQKGDFTSDVSENSTQDNNVDSPMEKDDTEAESEPIVDIITDNYTVVEDLNVNVSGVMRSDDKEKPYKCVLCEYKSRFKTSIQKHYIRKHTEDEARPFKCINCDYATKTKDKINLHITRSHSEEIVKCKNCAFTTNFKCALTAHQKVHCTLKCNDCEYFCKNKAQLDNHYASRHSEDKLNCKFCEFSTASQANLKHHENIHKGIRPFKCKFCDYRAVRQSLVNVHARKQHPDQVGTVVNSKPKRVKTRKSKKRSSKEDS